MFKWEFTAKVGTVLDATRVETSDTRGPGGAVTVTRGVTKSRIRWEESERNSDIGREEFVDLKGMYAPGHRVAVVYTTKNKHAADVNLMTGQWKLNPLTMSLGGVIYAIVSFLLIAAGGIGVLMLIGGLVYFMMMGAAYKKQVTAAIEEGLTRAAQ